MATTPIFFTCNHCTFKSKTQLDLNAHILFQHGFLNPECSTDTPSDVEAYMYSKNHFKKCIVCGYSKTVAYHHPERYTNFELTDPRNMINHLCYEHLDDFITNRNQRRYNNVRKYVDGLWQFMQSITKTKFSMYQRTLYRLHNVSKQKNKTMKEHRKEQPIPPSKIMELAEQNYKKEFQESLKIKHNQWQNYSYSLCLPLNPNIEFLKQTRNLHWQKKIRKKMVKRY